MSAVLQSMQTAFDAQQNVSARQRDAFATFLSRGLPTTKLDAWKYTDLRRLALRQFRNAAGSPLTADIEGLLLKLNARRFVFVDGVLSCEIPASSDSVAFPSIEEPNAESFELLNAALAKNTLPIDITEKSERTIYITHIWTAAANGVMTHPRVHLKIARNVRATIIEHCIGLNATPNLCNSVLDLNLGEHAHLEHIRIQDDAEANFNIANIRAQVAADAEYRQYHYVLGGGLARADIAVQLLGERAHTELHGVIFAQHTQHLDVHTCVDHSSPNTSSREDYRGIADHRGRVVFNGKVIVAKDAQKTDAAQSSRNLLLSPHAEIDTRPELQIDANDVKCAHGATVGQLDATALFYLQSRGIAQHEARALLTQAFAAELIERVPLSAVRDYVLDKLMSRLRAHGELA